MRNFWERQAKSRKQSKLCVALFFLMALTLGILMEMAIRKLFPEDYTLQIPLLFLLFSVTVLAVASYKFLQLFSQGGAYVASSLGGKPLNLQNPEEKKLDNIVEELILAGQLRYKPKIFLLPCEEINAFAAGLKLEKSAIAITKGAIKNLSREELQGVVAHEIGHIINRDMALNSQLGAFLSGFMFFILLGTRIFARPRYSSRRSSKNSGGVIVVAALLLFLVGCLSWFFGALIQALLSREREYLADATAVELTRNPHGLRGALEKISKESIKDISSQGAPFTHLYFNSPPSFLDKLFSSHPPIEERIKRLSP